MKNLQHVVLLIAMMFTFSMVEAHPSWGIVVDRSGNIYFADIMHNGMGSVWKLTHQGELELLFGNFHAHNVSLDKYGNLVTAHGENTHTMVRLNKDGSIDTLYHKLNYREFFGGNCTYSPRGEIIFSAENHLWRINSDGKKEKISNYKFEWNQTVYADESGNYYAPDIGEGVGKLIKIDSSGASIIVATDLISELERPFDPHADILMGITRGSDGNIYIAETAGQRIIKIFDNKKKETFYISDGDWFPTGIDFFSGDAYILEYKTNNGNQGPRIIKLDESGQKTELFNFDEYQKGHGAQTGTQKNNKKNWWIALTFALTVIALIIGAIKFKNYRRQLV